MNINFWRVVIGSLLLAGLTYGCGSGDDEPAAGGSGGSVAGAAGGGAGGSAGGALDAGGAAGGAAVGGAGGVGGAIDPCVNTILDGEETDIDCGGPDCEPCTNGSACQALEDCRSRNCSAGAGTAGAAGAASSGGAAGAGTAGAAGAAAGGAAGASGFCAPCDSDADCAASDYCDANASCVPKLGAGESCGNARDCLSGHCVDGVCCESACDGICEVCSQPGSLGSCRPRAENTDPQGECPGDTCSGVLAACRCQDATKNGDETDVDCGGSCAPCAAGRSCAVALDCQSGVCIADRCVLASCGDGIVQSGEECDGDGAGLGGETANCDIDCTVVSCGDGYANSVAGEACDSGGVDAANCDSDCTAVFCGDNHINDVAGEECDAGGVETGSCDSDCTLVVCGDSHVNSAAGEACDTGGVETANCDIDCTAVTCGDNHINSSAGETCDSGGVDTVGCDADCTSVSCGDGYTNSVAGEACDSGGVDAANCDYDCTQVSCGDNHTNTAAGELCDTGGVDTTSCDADCTSVSCGDSHTNAAAGEACDGGGVDTVDCNADCSAASCGDSYTNSAAGEACDSGGVDTTSCDADCTSVSCGDSYTNSAAGEACDSGGIDTTSCDSDCTSVSCGDSHTNAAAGEGCDDGNGSNRDDCPDGSGGSCQPANCNDGFVHDQGTGSETDVDCGGSRCGGCELGKACQVGSDCLSGVCDGLVCSDLAVSATDPGDSETNVAVTRTIGILFNAAVNPSTLTAQTAIGPCSGSIQVSSDDFASCIGLASGAPLMSASDTLATLSPALELSYATLYKIRVTTAVQSAAGAPLVAQFETTNGFITEAAPAACAPKLVINEIYGDGGSSGATYTHDFVELHNRSSAAVSLDGWSVQYSSASGTSWQVTNLTGSVAAGGYYLVQMAQGAGGTTPLPTPDAVGNTAMSGIEGKLALVSTIAPLSGDCPSDGSILDLVGFGSSASCYEGTAPAPGASNTTSVQRSGAGCVDANENSVDFSVADPTPQNSASSAVGCGCGTVNETGIAEEADYCVLQFPLTLSVSASTSTPTIFGRIYEAGVTEAAGGSGTLMAELGFGPSDGANPERGVGWQWIPAAFNVQVGNDDEYQASFVAPAASGEYYYTYRFSLDGGATWTYCDANGAGSNGGLSFETTQLGTLSVLP